MNSDSSLRRFLIVLFVFCIITTVDAQEKRLFDLNAKIEKSQISIQWKAIDISKFWGFRLELRKEMEDLAFSDEILVTNYTKFSKKDSLEIFTYHTNYKLKTNGVYYIKLSLLDTKKDIIQTQDLKIGVSSVKNFKLFQNSPNPFNPLTTITYELLESAYVRLKVYSLEGKEIDVLVDGYQNAGIYHLTFDASNYELSSGIYFYKISTGEATEIKKMIYAK
ncbi:MAG: T9SS type A sorting domain-containing protein [Ignavibacteria bacterium]